MAKLQQTAEAATALNQKKKSKKKSKKHKAEGKSLAIISFSNWINAGMDCDNVIFCVSPFLNNRRFTHCKSSPPTRTGIHWYLPEIQILPQPTGVYSLRSPFIFLIFILSSTVTSLYFYFYRAVSDRQFRILHQQSLFTMSLNLWKWWVSFTTSVFPPTRFVWATPTVAIADNTEALSFTASQIKIQGRKGCLKVNPVSHNDITDYKGSDKWGIKVKKLYNTCVIVPDKAIGSMLSLSWTHTKNI